MEFILFLAAAVCLAAIAAVIIQIRYKKRLAYLKYHDSVTGGRSGAWLMEIMPRLLTSGQRYAVVYTNFDKFKPFNNRHGFSYGDSLLQTVYGAMCGIIDPDTEAVARIYSDRFVLLLEYRGEEELCSRLFELNSVLERFNIFMECGVYAAEDASESPRVIQDRACYALHNSAGKYDRYIKVSFFDEHLAEKMEREQLLETKLTAATENREFKLYIQPKVRLSDERICGGEALIRWFDPDLGAVPPSEFVPVLERNGRISEIDTIMFERVCKSIRTWIDNGKQPVPISVNMSRVNLADPAITERYVKIVNAVGIPPEYIELELTETLVYENMGILNSVIDRLHSAGFSCSIDDFGNGYSSLALLKSISADTIKFDRAFFAPSPGEDTFKRKKIIESLITMVRGLGMHIVAEGVEDRADVKMLKDLGCDSIQGFVFYRPAEAGKFEAMLADAK